MKIVQWVRFGNRAFIRFIGAARTDIWLQGVPEIPRRAQQASKPKG